MFAPDRIFSQRNSASGEVEFFFSAREGVFGPYATRAAAKKILDAFVARRIESGDDGGRGSAKRPLRLALDDLALEAREQAPRPQQYEPWQRKKGKEG